MTKAEVIESLNLAAANGFEGYTMFITVTFAYLVVAYFVGAQLSRLQVLIGSVLYLTAGASFWLGTITHSASFEALAHEYQDLIPSRLWLFPWSESTTVLFSGGILASLYFMWDVRQPKTE